jgi:hypothetical protein
MWVVYQKKDRKVVGFSALCEPDLEKGPALDEVVKGLVHSSSSDKYDALQVRDPNHAWALMSAPIEHVVIAETGKGKLQATVESPKISYLLMQSDASDVHPVDGIAEIKADGTSFTTITVRKVDERGEPEKSRNDNDELHLRTTAGTLQSADGKEDIASVKLKQGQASFRLLSEKARRVATVTVISADPNLQDGSIRIEFI